MKKYFFVVLIFLIFGCASKEVKVSPKKEVLEKRAQRAFNEKKWCLAKSLYEKVFEKVQRDKKIELIKNLILSCIKCKDFCSAEKYLNLWKELQPQVSLDCEWYEINISFLKEKEGDEAVKLYLKELLTKPIPRQIKVCVVENLIQDYIKISFDSFFDFFETLFDKLDENEKKILSEIFLEQKILSYNTIGDLLLAIPSHKDLYKFPYILIRWKKISLDLEKKAITWPYAWHRFLNLQNHSQGVIKKILEKEFKKLISKYGPLNIKIGFLLPLDNIGISWKILKGAEFAQLELLANGVNIELYVINTLSDGWEKRLNRSDVVLFGGVLKKEVWNRISEKGLFNNKLFFVFRSLDKRPKENIFPFFPNYKDQITCTVKYLVENFNINKFGIFAPKSEFGVKMSEVFEKVVRDFGCEVVKKGFYTPKRHALWKYEVANFLNIPKEYFDEESEKKNFLITPEFQALFLPDSFEEAKILIPEFFFFDVDDVFFIGPILWAFEDTKVSKIDSIFYKLSLFPSPWDFSYEHLNPDLSRYYTDISLDFWIGLGYDFVRFMTDMITSVLKLKEDFVKDFLKKKSFAFDWTIEPIKWNDNLLSSETVKIFQPSIHGPLKPSKEKLKAILEYRIKEKENIKKEEQLKEFEKELNEKGFSSQKEMMKWIYERWYSLQMMPLHHL